MRHLSKDFHNAPSQSRILYSRKELSKYALDPVSRTAECTTLLRRGLFAAANLSQQRQINNNCSLLIV